MLLPVFKLTLAVTVVDCLAFAALARSNLEAVGAEMAFTGHLWEEHRFLSRISRLEEVKASQAHQDLPGRCQKAASKTETEANLHFA
jgi:hypothetical protein